MGISRPQAPMSLVALAFAAEASLPILAARRLFPGTTEESLVVRVCSRLGKELCASPCQLLDLVCQPPPGFNPLTACVCDRSGPRVQGGDVDDVFVAANCPEDSSPLCKTDSTGRHLGVFCQAPDFKRPKEEVCFVLPSADCSKTNGMQPVTCSGYDLEPCISNGPCMVPDSRSKVFTLGHSIGVRFAWATGVLGFITWLAALCACCLCCELHTGRSIGDQVCSLTMNQALNEESDEDEWT